MNTRGHETRDAQPATVVGWGAGIVGLIVFAMVAMWFLLSGLEDREARLSPPASPLADYAPKEPPAPRLQTDPWSDIAALRARERAQLDGYGWVDRETGTVHIPITRAMELLNARREGAGR